MDLGETLFEGLLRGLRKLRPQPAPAPPHAVCFLDEELRWSHTASLLCGAPVELKVAAGSGGVVGDVLLLPRRVELFDDPARNADALLYRLAFAASCRELACYLPGWAASEPHGTALATLLSVPGVRAHMQACLPGSARLAPSLHEAVLAGRPAPDPRSWGGVLEALVQGLLGAEPRWDVEPRPAASRGLAELQGLALAYSEGDRAASARACALAKRLVDALPAGRGRAPAPVPLWGELQAPPQGHVSEVEASPGESDAAADARRHVVDLERTLRMQRRRHLPREDRPLFHMFEKVETAEEYGGESGTPDDSGDVRQMRDAVDELQLGAAIRSDDDPRNLVRADVLVEGEAPDVADAGPPEPQAFRYPEWDARAGRYRPEWCTVYEQRCVAADEASGEPGTVPRVSQRRQVERIRGHLLRALFQRRTRNRQLDGPDIDVEAMVERHADLVAGHTPPERLYLSARRAPRDVAVLVLLDTSFSTDAWVEGRRVLDVEIEALQMLAEAFEGYLEQEVAVAGFFSRTRHDVRFSLLKDFDDRWSRLRRLAPGLQAEGYTRIGAALRHAASRLDATRARHKLLLLVSDCKPTDYDRYEGRHGVEDVAQAVREARSRGIHPFGLAVESRARKHLPRMLGAGAYRVLPRTSLLADAMGEVFVGLVAG